MKLMLLTCAFILSGCTPEIYTERVREGAVGTFPVRGSLPNSTSNNERIKEMRRDIMSGNSPRW